MMLPPLFQHSTRSRPYISPDQELVAEQPTESLPALPTLKQAASQSAGSPESFEEHTSTHLTTSDLLSEVVTSETSAQPKIERKAHLKRYAVLLLCAIIAVALFVVWTDVGASQSTAPSAITNLTTSPNLIGTPTLSANQTDTGAEVGANTIQVYVIGAIKHPGVYTLPTGARVYQLLQAAGGTLGSANLALINMAAKLSDGQEVYVVSIGETPPPAVSTGSSTANGSSTTQNATGTPVNINTASLLEMTQTLHISSTTANHIISYRQLHGNFSSIDQLLQVISATTYKKIKDKVTV